MFLHWIYKIWTWLLRFAGWGLLVISLLIVILIGGIQLPFVKNYVLNKAIAGFNDKYIGDLSVGKVTGFIPFRMDVDDILLSEFSVESDSLTADTLIFVPRLQFNLNPFDLFANKLSVQALSIHDPFVRIDLDSQKEHYRLNRAFQKKEEAFSEPRNIASTIEIVSPFLSISNGRLFFEPRPGSDLATLSDQPLEIEEINLSAFVELSDEQRFLDLQFLYFGIPQIGTDSWRFRGQVFGDGEYFELNGFRFNYGSSRLNLTSEIRGLDLFAGNIPDQLQAATYYVRLDSSRVLLSDFEYFLPGFNDYQAPITIDMLLRGNVEEIGIDRFSASYGESGFGLVGVLGNILEKDRLTYDVNLRNLNVKNNDLRLFYPEVDGFQFKEWEKLTVNGRVFGNMERTDFEGNIQTARGSLATEGDVRWDNVIDYFVYLNLNNLDLAQFTSLGLQDSRINATLRIDGLGTDPETMTATSEIKVYNTRYDNINVHELGFSGKLADGVLESEILLIQNGTTFEGNGTLGILGQSYLDFTGRASQLNLKDFTDYENLADTDLDLDISFRIRDWDSDAVSGRVSMDINRAVVGTDTLGLHQLYADLLDLPNGGKELRFTSTMLDFFVRGDVYPGKVIEMANYWVGYIDERVEEEFFFMQQDFDADDADISESDEININFDFTVKDLSILKSYLPSIPLISADFSTEGRIIADNQRFLVSGGLAGRSLQLNKTTLSTFGIQFTSSLQYDRQLREFSAIDVIINAEELTQNNFSVKGLSTSISMLNDSVNARINIRDIGNENYTLDFAVNSRISDSTLSFNIYRFDVGDERYMWKLDHPSVIRYSDDMKLHISSFILSNNDQRIGVSGVYSSDLDDVMNYSFNSVDLENISNIIAGRVSFQGILDGAFSSSTLLAEPVISGDLLVDHLRIDGRTIGDVTIGSSFNNVLSRFETHIDVKTPSEKYQTYLDSNNGIGNDIEVSGWAYTPEGTVQRDTLFFFDVDARQVDAWILEVLAEDIFLEVKGQAFGTGVFFGNSEGINFRGEFEVPEVFAVPAFLKTNYKLSGRVLVDRYEGIVLNDIQVSDGKRGTGKLEGSIGFNDFRRERPLNLTFELNRLEFLNNTYEPDVPFYGNVSGTGIVSLSGTNLSPFLRTVVPVTTTSDSRLSIPLLDETTVEEQARFIEFVTSFEEVFSRRSLPEEEQEVPRDRSFVETFKLDLQFIAPLNSTVQLVFDPLTGEILNARGNGRIRISLEDEVFQMFGAFNVNGGDYTFVGGDIFVRRFQLRDGGTISWEGDPDNARLNITTAYRSRPNIEVLTSRISDIQTRIPVDLILEITGTIQSIENNFYFEFPNALDVSQNATQLALLNSEDQKLIQATSLLFTGGFIPVGNAADGQFSDLGASLQSRAGQVGLSQLLSNQINAILNSSLNILDVDLNLTGFDQADLGIALRLFDDRLIFRGESQFSTGATTGSETMLGDLGVTYRINRALSIEIFHRRDPTLRSIVGNQAQAQSINGVGLEAQVQFNTWKELRQRLWGQIRRIFAYTPGTSDNQSTASH